MLLTNVYVDGFNLYYGCLKGTPYKWLDLTALCRILLPRHSIGQIRYFTARVAARPDDPQQASRQQVYLRALESQPQVSVHLGHYLTTFVRMPLAYPSPSGPRTVEVIKTEEKASDVNLATHLLLDAFRGRCQCAVVISNDSDLKEPIEVAQRELGLSVGVINPHAPGKRSRDLMNVTFFKQIRQSGLARAQFPAEIRTAQGVIRKPLSW